MVVHGIHPIILCQNGQLRSQSKRSSKTIDFKISKIAPGLDRCICEAHPPQWIRRSSRPSVHTYSRDYSLIFYTRNSIKSQFPPDFRPNVWIHIPRSRYKWPASASTELFELPFRVSSSSPPWLTTISPASPTSFIASFDTPSSNSARFNSLIVSIRVSAYSFL